MNPLEFSEAFAALVEASISATALYVTAVSGYLVVAYLAAEKLTRSQLIIISALFILFALVMTLAGFSLSERAIELEVAFEGKRDLIDSISYFMLAAQILGIVAALKFMLDARDPR